MKKKLTYLIAFLYISVPVVMFMFRIGDNISINPIIDAIIILLLVPVSSIIALLGFFGGRMGIVIGTIITIGIAVFLIEWFFKKRPTD